MVCGVTEEQEAVASLKESPRSVLLLFCLVLLRRIVVLSCVQLIQVRLALRECEAFVLTGSLCSILSAACCVPLSGSCCAVVL